jgi:hypothetical protein
MGPFVSQNAPDPENGTKSSGTWCNMSFIGFPALFYRQQQMRLNAPAAHFYELKAASIVQSLESLN